MGANDVVAAMRPHRNARAAASGSALDVTVGEAAAPADVAPRQLPPVMAHAHAVSARAATEPGEADFGKALQRWLDLERQRISGEFSHLDQVQAVAEAYATPGSAPPSRPRLARE